MTRRGTLRILREVFLTAGALVGVVCILATVSGAAFGIKPLVFRSGSMSPAIHVGDLAVSRTVDASSLERGDVVSVLNADGNRVTHRVVSIASQGGTRQLTLRGDANRSPDAEVYTVTRVEKVLFDVPKLGYVVDAAASPAGLFVLGLYVAGMLTVILRRPPGGSGDHDRPRGGARRAVVARGSRAASRSTIAMTAAATVLAANPASAAPWTDAVPVTDAALSASTIATPATFTCGTLGVASVTFNWAAVAGATSYTVHFGPGGASTRTVTGTSTTITTAISNGTAWVVANRVFTSTTWTSAASNTRTYTVAFVSLCG